MKSTPRFNKEGVKRMNITISEELWYEMDKIIKKRKDESFSSIIEMSLDMSIKDIEVYCQMRDNLKSEIIKTIRKEKGEAEAKKATIELTKQTHKEFREKAYADALAEKEEGDKDLLMGLEPHNITEEAPEVEEDINGEINEVRQSG